MRVITVWYSVSIISLVSVFAQIDRGIITLLITPIKRDLGLTDTELSLLIGFAFSLFYVGASLPLSRLADNWSRKRVLAGALAAWSLATAACGLAQTFMQFFLLRGLVGAGEGVKSPCSTSMIADLVPRERMARAYAIFNLATNAGAALALVVGGALLALLADTTLSLPGFGTIREWQMIFFIVGIPGILFAALMMLTLPEPGRSRVQRRETPSIKAVLGLIVQDRSVLLPLLIISTLNSIQAGGMAAWRPAFFERSYGWGPEVAGPWLGSTYLASCAVALFLGTWFAEWLTRRHDDANMRLVLIAQAAAAPIFALSPLAPTGLISIAMMTVAMTLTLSAAPCFIAALQIITPRPMRSQISAIYFITLNVVGVAGGPLFVAFMTDTVFGAEDMLRYSLVAIILLFAPPSLWLSWRILKPYGQRYREEFPSFAR